MKKAIQVHVLAVICALPFSSLNGWAGDGGSEVSLQDTIWERASLGVSPPLLYAIALTESRSLGRDNLARPRLYIVRDNSTGEIRSFATYQDAAEFLSELTPAEMDNLDIGPTQVSWRYHSDRVEEASELLIPAISISVAAQILRTTLASTDDPVLGVGRYHNWNPGRAREYGRQVLSIACNLDQSQLPERIREYCRS